MTSNRFFVRKNQSRSSEASLEGEEHHHLSRVARSKPPDRVWLCDVVLERFRDLDSGQNPVNDVMILVGPEGGWTNGEAKDILGRGFKAVSLGETILRAETAAICSLAILNQFWE